MRKSTLIAVVGALMVGCSGGNSGNSQSGETAKKYNPADYLKEDVVKRQVNGLFKAVEADQKAGKTTEELVGKYCTADFAKLYKESKALEDKYIATLPKWEDGTPDFGDGWYPLSYVDPWGMRDSGELKELEEMTVSDISAEKGTAKASFTVGCYVPSTEECPDCDGWNYTPMEVELCLKDTTWQISNITHVREQEESGDRDFIEVMNMTIKGEGVVPVDGK